MTTEYKWFGHTFEQSPSFVDCWTVRSPTDAVILKHEGSLKEAKEVLLDFYLKTHAKTVKFLHQMLVDLAEGGN